MLQSSYCDPFCETQSESDRNVWPGGLFTRLELRSPFKRVLDSIRADFRSIQVDGQSFEFEDSLEQANVSCSCDGDMFEDVGNCTSSDVVCSSKIPAMDFLHFEWTTTFDVVAQLATSELTLFAHHSGSMTRNVNVSIGFDKSLKRNADSKHLAYSTSSTLLSIVMRDEGGQEQEVTQFDIEVEPQPPAAPTVAPGGLEIRPPQKKATITIPAEMTSYSISVVTSLSVPSCAVLKDATFSLLLFLVLQLVLA